jgi:hypothetical protein
VPRSTSFWRRRFSRSSVNDAKILSGQGRADDFRGWNGWCGWCPSRFSYFVKCLSRELCKGRSKKAECRMPGARFAQRLCGVTRRSATSSSSGHVFCLSSPIFRGAGRVPPRLGSSRTLSVRSSRMIRLCSLMSAYVRIYSLIVKKMAAARQGNQPGIIFVFGVGDRAPVFRRDGNVWLSLRRAGRHGSTAGGDARRHRRGSVPAADRTAKCCACLRLIALNFFLAKTREVRVS